MGERTLEDRALTQESSLTRLLCFCPYKERSFWGTSSSITMGHSRVPSEKSLHPLMLGPFLPILIVPFNKRNTKFSFTKEFKFFFQHPYPFPDSFIVMFLLGEHLEDLLLLLHHGLSDHCFHSPVNLCQTKIFGFPGSRLPRSRTQSFTSSIISSSEVALLFFSHLFPQFLHSLFSFAVPRV
jgi:hypothetical protein